MFHAYGLAAGFAHNDFGRMEVRAAGANRADALRPRPGILTKKASMSSAVASCPIIFIRLSYTRPDAIRDKLCD